ncbi:monocarboxylate transporter 12-like [Tropilaelaps mercedesae]|uniref:Monocarboxylate transporter 12-like n=1 Tax=Tropilaelaps mercedesae TaxID=418985 RepID=A0A1V9Y204_9ACAR|nr:monocarboxylate transporter 12-like [Tropilaelaps mercedesae]
MSSKELLANSTSSGSGTTHTDGTLDDNGPAQRPRTWSTSTVTSQSNAHTATTAITEDPPPQGSGGDGGRSTPGGGGPSTSGPSLKLGSSNPTTLEEHRRSSYVGRDSAPPTATAANLSRREAEQRMATIRQHYYPEGEWGWAVVGCAAFVNALTFGLQLNFSAEMHRHIVQRYGRDHYFSACE